jgi:hypothetical protein
MNKKYLSFFLLGLFVFSMLGIGMVSAETKWVPVSGEGITAFLQGVVNVASPITGFLFGSDRSTGENGFIALTAFLLTLLVVFGVLNPLKLFGQANENNWINFAIAFIVSLIGVRFVPIEMLSNFTLGAEGLVGALFLVIPFFVVTALILKSPHNAVRKILWTVYGVVILGIFFHKIGTKGWDPWSWIYVAILVICIILFSLDGTIQKMWKENTRKSALGSYEEDAKNRAAGRQAERIETESRLNINSKDIVIGNKGFKRSY